MTNLEKMIQELCPNGVEYKELGEVCSYASQRIDADMVNEENYVGVDNLLPDKMGKTVSSYVPKEGRLIRFDEGDILIGNIRPYLKKIWLATHDGGTNGDVLTIQIHDRKKIFPRFLYYILSSDSFFLYDMQNAKGAKMPRGSKEAVLKYFIPVPPLAIQREIVHILDQFTELIKELEAELAERKKQQDYYLGYLITEKGFIGSKTCNLGEVVDICVGNKPDVILEEFTEFEYINAGTSNSGYAQNSNCLGDTVTTPSRGQGGIGYIGYQNKPFYLGPLCYAIRSKNLKLLLNKYIYYFLTNNRSYIIGLKKEGGTPAVNKSDLLGIKIIVPPIEKQIEVVSILDNFDSLCTEITAEIESRRKQYEYYRDKLLTFPQAN